MADSNNLFVNFVLGLMGKKAIIPSDFHGQCQAISTMLDDDVSGLVDSLTDFSVQSASVKFTIETDNPTFTEKLAKWLENVNAGYNGQIPRGIDEIAKEYFKERWKGSSFPILKIFEWGNVDGIVVPTKMNFIDGSSIYAKDISAEEKLKSLLNYEYYLGSNCEKKYKLGKGTIITKPFSRLFEKYPKPFLIKRGIYHNWKIIQSLRNNQSEVLDQIIPYMLLIKKGTDALATNNIKVYSQAELDAITKQFQDMQEEVKGVTSAKTKAPTRTTQYDEELKHMIPDLSTLFSVDLFAGGEKAILAGLGLIDIAEAYEKKKASILNPKIFIEDVSTGVKDFKSHILTELVAQIIDKNKSHRKYVTSNFYISNSPITAFMTEEFRTAMRLCYKNGGVSIQTYQEVMGVDYRTEKYRRDRELKNGDEMLFYPHLVENAEQHVTYEEEERRVPKKKTKTEDKNGKVLPTDKTEKEEKIEYKIDSNVKNLTGAPYQNIKELPPEIKDNMDKNLQRVFVKVFNQVYEKYQSDSRAFRISWGVIRKIAKKDKNGKWVKKDSKTRVTKAMIENTEKEIV